ncbi:MAG: phosphoenolpyruvate carboxylase [Candidatus Aenigmarchaeota archaeon]|nr:phosphoenolpyruvate carboxylase [Candidatus Aenigmarchaeota archaeon]
MSTQHPDNVRTPFFCNGTVISGDDEVKEAFYAYSHLGCEEQLWDCEGKEVDTHVVKKLLTNYGQYFSSHALGKETFLTMRVPNPEVEKNEAKILLETLESIPRNSDIARAVYGNGVCPIFEVALPMTASAVSLSRIREYYRKFVSGKGQSRLIEGDESMENWMGAFLPGEINVIPLFETKENILNAHNIVKEYAAKEKLEEMRVWLARSDPALNYGSLAAVLLNKIALQRIAAVDVKTFPILGCGSAPFRGNLTPSNLSCLQGYPSVHTFTVQSAFKYDYDERDVAKAVEKINASRTSRPSPVEEDEMLRILDKTSEAYMRQVSSIAPLVSDFAMHVPARRKRKLHIGLFGYSRASGGVSLPRAIAFCASLYSLGLPPEILGLSALSRKDVDIIIRNYGNFEKDMEDALRYLNKDNLRMLPHALREEVETALGLFDFETDAAHKAVTDSISQDYAKKSPSLQENITRAGAIRGFLG